MTAAEAAIERIVDDTLAAFDGVRWPRHPLDGGSPVAGSASNAGAVPCRSRRSAQTTPAAPSSSPAGGRPSLWTGDLGVACVLQACLVGDARMPTVDVS